MSIANNRLTPHRKPKITRLPEGRLQVERWFRIGAEVDTEGNARLTARIFGGYGLLDGTTATEFEKTELPASAFTDCRLVDENTDEQFTQSGKRYHILYQKYQTLTASWALEDEDKEAAEKNGLRMLTRSEVAIPETAAPYDEDDVGVATITSPEQPDAMVVDGAGTASVNNVYLRDGDFQGYPAYTLVGGVSGVDSLSFLGVTPWAIGSQSLSPIYYESSEGGLATPDLVTSWSVSVDGTAPAPTVRRATWADIDEAGIDRSTVPLRTDVATLYLAGFDDDSDDRRGRFVSKWVEAGILRVRTEQVGGQQRVIVSALGLSQASVTTELSAVTASHKLVDVSQGDYDGFQTIDYTFEVNDFDVLSETENGLDQLTRTQLSESNFTRSQPGTATYSGLTLVGEEIDNGNTIKKRVSRYSEAGLISVKPIDQGSFSLVQQYAFTSVGLTPEALHAIAALAKPGGGTIAADAIFFEPEVVNVEGFPRYTQIVTNAALDGGGETLVHTKEDFFTVTDPGVMGAGFQWVRGDKSGAASVFPQAASMPKTYRKKGTINVYLTTNPSIPETEVAYQDRDIQWAQQATYNLYFNNETGAASGNGGWRSFPGYLDDGLGDAWAEVSQIGTGENWEASAYSYKSGSTSYNKTGVYRVMPLREYFKSADGTQYYLRTVISFD